MEGGRVIGATNREGADAAQRPVDMPDLRKTIFPPVGIDPETEYEVEARPATYGHPGDPRADVTSLSGRARRMSR